MILNFFGIGRELDIYFGSNSINFILVSISIGAINFAITPILINYYKNNNHNKLEEIVCSLFNIIFVGFFIFALFQYLIAPYLLRLILPGFSEIDLDLAIRLFRFQAFISIITVLSSILLALHYTFNLLYRTILYPIITNLVQIIFVWMYYKDLGVFSLLIGLAVSQSLSFILFSIPFLKLYKFKIVFSKDLKDASQKIYPLILSSSFAKSNILIDRFFASTLSTGSISLLQYGEKIIKMISEFINKGISLVSLRKFSLEQDNEKEFQRLFYKICKTMIFIVVPVCFLIIDYLKDALNLVILSDKLSYSDLEKIYLVAIAFIGIFIGGSLSSTITNAFYAKGLTKIIAKVNVFMQVFAISLKIFMFYLIGFWGLPLAFSISSVIGSIVLFILYYFYIYKYDNKLLVTYILKILILSFISYFLSKYIIDFNLELEKYRVFIGPFLFMLIFTLLSLIFEKDISNSILTKLLKTNK
jgi:putative peptidoglycan lipid II flippase